MYKPLLTSLCTYGWTARNIIPYDVKDKSGDISTVKRGIGFSKALTVPSIPTDRRSDGRTDEPTTAMQQSVVWANWQFRHHSSLSFLFSAESAVGPPRPPFLPSHSCLPHGILHSASCWHLPPPLHSQGGYLGINTKSSWLLQLNDQESFKIQICLDPRIVNQVANLPFL